MDDEMEKNLIGLACRLGASAAATVSTEAITVDDALADLCRQSRCANYGLSAHCPPHVCGPVGFRELVKDYRRALVFKIDVPAAALVAEDNRDRFMAIQHLAAKVERAAVAMGHPRAMAFAGSSCKLLFCQEHAACRVLAENGACRHPDKARPSMSGFGINVSALVKAVGWQMDRITRDTDPQAVDMGTLCGLVLLG